MSEEKQNNIAAESKKKMWKTGLITNKVGMKF